jgi:hypothetical protein
MHQPTNRSDEPTISDGVVCNLAVPGEANECSPHLEGLGPGAADTHTRSVDR